jgi:hypothetical protein
MVFRACNYLFKAKLIEPEMQEFEEHHIGLGTGSGLATGPNNNTFF